ncbi:hypothetical protein ACFQ2B_31765 [Streptomyces stramineus]
MVDVGQGGAGLVEELVEVVLAQPGVLLDAGVPLGVDVPGGPALLSSTAEPSWLKLMDRMVRTRRCSALMGYS